MAFKICYFCIIILLLLLYSASSFLTISENYKQQNSSEIQPPKEQTVSSYFPNVQKIWQNVGNQLSSRFQGGEQRGETEIQEKNVLGFQDARYVYFVVGILLLIVFVVGVLVGVIFVNYRNKIVVKSTGIQVGIKLQDNSQNLQQNDGIKAKNNGQNQNSGQKVLDQKNQNLLNGVKATICENSNGKLDLNLYYTDSPLKNDQNQVLQDSPLKQNQSFSTEFSSQENDENAEFNSQNVNFNRQQKNDHKIENSNQIQIQNQNFGDGASVTTVESIMDDRFRDFVMNGGNNSKFENEVSQTMTMIEDLQLELHGNQINNNNSQFSFDQQFYHQFQRQFYQQLKRFENKKNLTVENELTILKLIQSMVDNSMFQKFKQESLKWKEKSADAQTKILNLKQQKAEIEEYQRLEKEAQQGPGFGLLLILTLGYFFVMYGQLKVGQMRRNFASVLLIFIFVGPGGYAIKSLGGSWLIWGVSSFCWCILCLIGVDLMMKIGAVENFQTVQTIDFDGHDSKFRKNYKIGLDFTVKAVYYIVMVFLFPMLEVLLPFIAA